MTRAATLPKPEAIASGAATGLSRSGRAPGAWPAPALRAAGAFAPTRAGTAHAENFRFCGTPLGLRLTPSANGPGDLPLAGRLIGPKGSGKVCA